MIVTLPPSDSAVSPETVLGCANDDADTRAHSYPVANRDRDIADHALNTATAKAIETAMATSTDTPISTPMVI